MSRQHSFNIPAHENIYVGSRNRELRIDFCEPQDGINADTGLLVLVPGFGANIDSKVYKKMRELFADQFNVITIQCNYFGSAYMQEIKNISFRDMSTLETIFTQSEIETIKQDHSMFANLLSEKEVVFPINAEINESLEEFNDMSYMQAIDIITSIESVKFVLKDNDFAFNSNRIIGYGHSHGAYLLHLCNVLKPDLFSFIIDNSAWIEPKYIRNLRVLTTIKGKATVKISYDYLARKIIKNIADLNLEELYKNYTGSTQILCFQGDKDNLVDYEKKRNIIEKINNSKFILVTQGDIDNKKYKSNTHGLSADFLELFTYALGYEVIKESNVENELKYVLDFDGVQIDVDYTLDLPVFKFKFK